MDRRNCYRDCYTDADRLGNGQARDAIAINITHRPDLDDQVERLAVQLGLPRLGRKTAVIEKALQVLEEQVGTPPSRSEVRASLGRILENGRRLRREVLRRNPDLKEPLSQTLQDGLYDRWGLPK